MSLSQPSYVLAIQTMLEFRCMTASLLPKMTLITSIAQVGVDHACKRPFIRTKHLAFTLTSEQTWLFPLFVGACIVCVVFGVGEAAMEGDFLHWTILRWKCKV